MRPCLSFARDGHIRYDDFLRAIEKQGDSSHGIRSPLGRRASTAVGGGTQRQRLAETLRRAVARGVDYRREMELQDGAAPKGGEGGVISCQTCVKTGA